MRAGTVPARSRSRDTTWLLWCDYCESLGVEPMLSELADPIPFLQVFAQRWHSGAIAPRGQPVRARTVEDALRFIGQMLARMGARVIRLNQQGKLEYRLQQQLKGYKWADVPPSRVKPVPFYIIDHANHVARAAPSPIALATADLATIALFFLLRPGEYTQPATQSNSQPFRLNDVTFKLGAVQLNAVTAPHSDILWATFVTLTFTSQKNDVRGEIVGHARIGKSLTCPVFALACRVCHLRQHQAAPIALLCTGFAPSTPPMFITARLITDNLCCAAAILYPQLGFDPADISARSIRAGGAMALLCTQIDSNIIKLVGRWHSDEMLRYLHLQAYPLMGDLAPRMICGGQFRLLSHQTIPAAAAHLFAAAGLPATLLVANVDD